MHDHRERADRDRPLYEDPNPALPRTFRGLERLINLGHEVSVRQRRVSDLFRAIVADVEVSSRSLRRAFTATELMNFVALAAILSAIGMYALARYVRHAKTTEATSSVTKIAERSAEYYNRSDETQPQGASPQAIHAMRHFPPGARFGVPAEAISVRGQRYQSNNADWAASPWKELGFSIVQPQCYQYGFESEGAGAQAKATVTAEGDLDADGQRSKYSITIIPDDALTAKIGPLQKADPEE
jgi:hypothetical protein